MSRRKARAVTTLDGLPWVRIEADRANGRQYAELADGRWVWAPLVTLYQPPYPTRKQFGVVTRRCLEGWWGNWVCSLPAGHSGMHADCSLPDTDGTCMILAEWGAP